MSNFRIATWNLSIVSATVLCFEIIATRVSSVIFVNNYAFMILSLAILGLASGGIYAYYKDYSDKEQKVNVAISKILLMLCFSLLLFILAVTQLFFIQNPIFYFVLLFLPFFFAGIFYALVFQTYATESFKIYAADLAGAAIGSIAPIAALTFLDPGNAVILLSLISLCSALSFKAGYMAKGKVIASFVCIFIIGGILLISGNSKILGDIPVGDFPEKDIHHAYPNIVTQPVITDSRWSVFGRSDLVEYSHQNVVKHLFIDGAAGSQMYAFSGDLNRQDATLTNMLLSSTSFMPFLFLSPEEKNNMLVIGPGGGKEVLSGLVTGINNITGIEINSDFVNIVKDQSHFNGGIYTDFPGVDIKVLEGRQYVKRTANRYDMIVMALPSTQQLQSIDNFALSENYLLTVEAIKDYIDILTPEGQLAFTVHNTWELRRLLVSAIDAFSERGVNPREFLNHIMIIEKNYAPTVVIKKNSFSRSKVEQNLETISRLVAHAPAVTYMPYQWDTLSRTNVNYFLSEIYNERKSLEQIVQEQPYDISASYDDKPYFYNIEWGLPTNFKWLFLIVFAANILLIMLPLSRIKINKDRKAITKPLIFFVSIGVGFMILEISLFQKMILYLGSPTISLSILLSSLLVGMGTGSFYGKRFYSEEPKKRLFYVSFLIVIMGVIVIFAYPYILSQLLAYDLIYRAVITFLLLLPFGFLLGVPFPTCIQLLESKKNKKYIPWMYGVNGAMSVLGSVLAVILSMYFGFTPAFIIGLAFYLFIVLILFKSR